MELALTNQVVVVAGSANGIGRAIATEFAAEGAQVALLDRDLEVMAAAEQLQAEHSGQFLPLNVDVSDYGRMQQAAQEIEQKLGPVGHVVFSVGIPSGKIGFPFWNLEPADWERVLRVNLVGAVNTIHAFIPPMRERKRGTFLFLASVAGQTGSQTDPPYSASKAALINFAQCAAKDLAAYNIRVNILNPGLVNTAMNRQIWAASVAQLPLEVRPDFESWAADKIKRMMPLNRWIEARDVAAMAVFLASERARNITGQAINVDGGYVMHS